MDNHEDIGEFTQTTVVRPDALKGRIQERPHSIFFYPAGLYDWEPLRAFNGLCDTFIYCDVLLDPERFDHGVDSLRTMQGVANVGQPQDIAITSLGCGISAYPWGNEDHNRSLERYLTAGFIAAYEEAVGMIQQPWGRQIALHIGRKESMVYCFHAEAFWCYFALFTRHNIAPKVVCLKTGGGRRFLEMDRWAAPLGRAVADSPQPELLVTNFHRQDDWPWRRMWQQYPEWDAVAYWRQHPVTWPLLPSTQ